MSHFLTIDVPIDVIRAAGAGDPRAHAEIFQACQAPLYTLIRRLIHCRATSDDLFQDTFVEILRSIGAYRGEGSFGGWVRSIAVSKCLMHLRSPWHRSLLWLDGSNEDSLAAHMADPAAGPDAQMEAQTELARALGALPPLTRSVVWLHDVEGYTHAEIAHLLGRTASFSKSQLARAHVRLRCALQPDDESVSCTPVSTNC